jgi:hypothetical protein
VRFTVLSASEFSGTATAKCVRFRAIDDHEGRQNFALKNVREQKSRGQGNVINSFPATDKRGRGESRIIANRKANFAIDLMSSVRVNSRSDHAIAYDSSWSHRAPSRFFPHARIECDRMRV